MNILDWIPKYIKHEVHDKPKQRIDSDYWNTMWNMLITQGDNNTEGILAIKEKLEHGLDNDEDLTKLIHEALAEAKASGEFDGPPGDPGPRGLSIGVINTQPTSVNTTIANVEYSYRINTAIAASALGSSVKKGDILLYHYHLYPVAQISGSYCYFKTRISIRGANGSAANVTLNNIVQALGYTPAKHDDIDHLSEEIAELKAYVYSEITGEVDDNNNIVITGVLSDGTYTLKYENEDGTTTEIGTFTVGEIVTAYTNLFDSASATLNMRWSDSGGGFTSTADGYVATDYIPVKLSSDASKPTLLRFRGASFAGNAAITFFDSTKKTLQASDAASAGTGVKPGTVTISTDENGDSCINLGWKNGSFHSNFANAAYFRIGLQVNANSAAITTADIQNIIVTLDEPIVD